MRLEDLIDLEAALAADRNRDPETLRARDRELFGHLKADPDDRHALLADWLAALRTRDGEPSLGRRVCNGYRWLTYLLVLSGLLAGWGTANVLLHYDGRTPVNVANFLLVVIGVQLLLLAGFVIGLPLARAFPRLPLAGDLRALLRWLAAVLEQRLARAAAQLSPTRSPDWHAARGRLRARASLYRDVEQWVLLGLTQVFGVAFNLGVLTGCIQLVVFSDLAFAWSTTLQVDASDFHRLVAVLAAPWSQFWPEAVPTLELVDSSRYSRLHGDYTGGGGGRAADPVLVGGWWRFLLTATVMYGLLPRVIFLLSARIARARALRTVPLDTPDVDRIVRRLCSPRVDTRAPQLAPQLNGRGSDSDQNRLPDPESKPSPSATSAAQSLPQPAPPQPAPPQPAPPQLAPPQLAQPAPPTPAATASARHSDDGDQGGRCTVVCWRDLPTAETAIGAGVQQQLGLAMSRLLAAGGADYDADREACATLAAQPNQIVVLAEAWEAPDKGLLRFLRDLRAAVGPGRSVVVGLVGEAQPSSWIQPDPDTVSLWRRRIDGLGDPYLDIEAMEVP